MQKTFSARVKKGMALAAQRGRRPGRKQRVSDDAIRQVIHLGTMEAARAVGLSRSQYIARRRVLEGSNNV